MNMRIENFGMEDGVIIQKAAQEIRQTLWKGRVVLVEPTLKSLSGQTEMPQAAGSFD